MNYPHQAIYNMTPAFQRVVIEVDVPYIMTKGGVSKQVRFVPTSRRGFNFEEEGSYKKVFKKHIYPQEIKRVGLKVATLILPKQIKFEKL